MGGQLHHHSQQIGESFPFAFNVTDHLQLDQRVPIFHNNLKSYASQAIVAHFSLHSNCRERSEWSRNKMRYIYPCDVQVSPSEPHACPAHVATETECGQPASIPEH